METADNLRNDIIDKLLTISNKDYLLALNKLIEKSSVGINTVKLTEDQIQILLLSEMDIKKGKIISQDQLDQNDQQWLKEL